MTEKTIVSRQENEMAEAREKTRDEECYTRPPVDIYETEEDLVVITDLPGVSQKDLQVNVDRNILTIQAHPSHKIYSQTMDREFQFVNFFRQFSLSDRIDQSKIRAELKHGVLTLRLPKAEEVKPRSISVQVS